MIHLNGKITTIETVDTYLAMHDLDKSSKAVLIAVKLRPLHQDQADGAFSAAASRRSSRP